MEAEDLSAVGLGRVRREHRVARRAADAFAQPVGEPQHEHLQPSAGHRDERPHGRRQPVAGEHQRLRRAPAIRHPAGDDLEEAVGRFGDALDDAERHRAGAEHARQEQRHQWIDHFARGVGEEAHPPEQPDRTRKAASVRDCTGQYNRPGCPRRPFDAVLLIAFGGPQGQPTSTTVPRQRPARPARGAGARRRSRPSLRAVRWRLAAHPTDGGAGRGLRAAAARAAALPCRCTSGCATGIRSSPTRWPTMSRAGVRRAVGLIAAAHRSYSSCLQYKRERARRSRGAARAGPRRRRGHLRRRLVHASGVHRGIGRPGRRGDREVAGRERVRATLVFTAHSIPTSMAARYPYQEQYETTARLIAVSPARLDRSSAARGDRLSEPQRPPRGSVART